MKKLLLLAAVLVGCCACDDEPQPEIINPAPEQTLVEISANIDARVHLEGSKNVWDATDVIGAFAENNSNIKFSTTQQNLGKFTAMVTGTPSEYFFYYPYNEKVALSPESVLSAELPAEQSLLVGTFGSTLPLAAYDTDLKNGVSFQNVCSALSFTVKSNIDRVLTKVEFQSTDGTPVAGPYVIDMVAETLSAKMSIAANISKLTLNGNVEMTAEEEYKFYVILPPSTHQQGFTLTMTDSEDRVFEQEYTKPLTVKNGVMTNIATTIEFNEEIPVEPEPVESRAHWLWATSDMIVNNVSTTPNAAAIDLSNGGTALANCYIVSAAGTYSIPAKQLDGRGVDAENPDAVITFTTTGTEGNAVIAYTDSEGKIVWSWHIWCTDAPAELKWGTNTWLDRNIGATTTAINEAASYGLMYQWGRKDPFPGSKLYSWAGTNDEPSAFSADYTIATVVNTEKFAESVWNFIGFGSSGQSVGLTIAEAVAQPMTLAQNSTAADPDPSCADGNKNFNNVARPWVAGMCAVEYSKLWLESEKTIYDPCPAGYRVPTLSQMKADFYDLSSQFTLSSSDDAKNNGASGPTWVPAAGYRTYSGAAKLFKVGTMGHYWSATPYFSRSSDHHYGALAYTMAIREATAGTYGFTVNGQLKASENAVVRCVKY